MLLAVLDAAFIAARLPWPAAGAALRLAHHVFDAGETVGLGASIAVAVGAFAAWGRRPRWAAPLLAVAVTALIVHHVLGEELTRVASLALEGRFEHLLFAGFILFLGLLIPGAAAASALLSPRPWWRLFPLTFAVGVLVGNHVPLPDDYCAIHGVVAWGAAMMGGMALSVPAERVFLRLRRRPGGRAGLVAVGLVALLGVIVPPANAVRFELFRNACTVAPWVLATALWRAPRLHGPVAPLPPSPWFEDRSAAPAVAPSATPLLPHDAVVVLVTVDAVRADVVADPANAALFPTLTELARQGVVFTRASAPASQTVLSLGGIFSGRYFSQLVWNDYGVGRTRHLYPSQDPSPRFPQILSDHGVATANFAGLIFLGNAWGVARGFREETITVESWRHARAQELVNPLLERLQRAGPGPHFLYTHLMEPHEPYDRGQREGPPRQRYLSEIAVADAQIGRVLRLLRRRFPGRWALFVSADHGEAFGDHGSFQHGKTLYEELIHVPLLACSPRFPPGVVDEPVGLIDLGPTILDLFGQETPATFLGQSLTPLLGGGQATFTRPLAAEGRLRRSLTSPDRLKVIEDLRRKIVEVYDLSADPGETRNLFDEDPARADRLLAAQRAFFAVHGRAEVPYKP